MLTMTATTQEIPPDHKGIYDLAVREVEVTAEDYDLALASVKSQLEEGWRIIAVRVDRDQTG